MIFDKMRNSDVIIFGTPVYIFNMSGSLKNLFERLVFTSNINQILIMKNGLFFHNIDKQLCSKPFVTLICQDNLERETHKNILTYFKTYSKFMECKQVGSLIRRSGIFEGYGKDESKLKQYPQLKDIYNAFYYAGVELARYGRVTHKTQKKANKRIIKIPIFLKLMLKFKFFRKSFQDKISQKIEETT
jgi:multimeric flavodoxin WrbA